MEDGASALAGPKCGLDNNKQESSKTGFLLWKKLHLLYSILRLRLPPLPSTIPISEYLPLPLLSRSVSDMGMDGNGGTIGAPCARQLPAAAAVAAAALSATSASVTVLIMTLDGCCGMLP